MFSFRGISLFGNENVTPEILVATTMRLRRRRGRDGGRGGGDDGSNFVVEAHSQHQGVFVVRKGNKEQICTINMVPGETVYGETLHSAQNEDGTEVEYRLWNPSRSKLAAVILKGVDNIWIKPGSKVLYLGADSFTTVSHVSNIVGASGMVYAVTSSPCTELTELASTRANVRLIDEDPRNPATYHQNVGMVDTILSEVPQLYQAKMMASNASYCLDVGCHFVVSIKANCLKSTIPIQPYVVIGVELEKLREQKFDPYEHVTLKRDHVYLIGVYKVPNPLFNAV